MGISYIVPVLLYFVSGFCGLVYEIVWSRMLVLVMGNTTYATSTILASFMAGLCLGSFYWGRKIDSLKSAPLFVFGCLEIIVGVSALILYFAVQSVVPLEIIVISGVSKSMAGSVLVRFVFSFVLLCIPTFFMGGTFAVIGKHIIGKRQAAGSRSALLYGVNTGGGSTRCLSDRFLPDCPFWSLQSLDVRQLFKSRHRGYSHCRESF